jgi:hypothetical protein
MSLAALAAVFFALSGKIAKGCDESPEDRAKTRVSRAVSGFAWVCAAAATVALVATFLARWMA